MLPVNFEIEIPQGRTKDLGKIKRQIKPLRTRNNFICPLFIRPITLYIQKIVISHYK
jgi:hypothetical protein